MSKLSFESKMSELEKIVSTLQQGEISLEESLKLFEKGAKLVSDCTLELNNAEQKVTQILMTPNGPVEETFLKED